MKAVIGRIMLTALAGISLSAGAVDIHQTDAFEGSTHVEGSKRELRWKAWFNVPAEQVVQKLTQWEKSHLLMENGVSVEVTDQMDSGATIAIQRETLPFLPDMTLVFKTEYVKNKDESVRVRWNQIEGPADSIRREWRVSPAGSGAYVEYSLRIEMPFTPPEVLMDTPEEKLRREIAVARARFGATKMSRFPPVPQTN